MLRTVDDIYDASDGQAIISMIDRASAPAVPFPAFAEKPDEGQMQG
jgi:hypothetical protein